MLNRRTPSPPQRGQADQVHCGAGRRQDTPFPRHTTQEERGWTAWMSLSTGSPRTRTGISTLSTIIHPREERCGEMSP